MLDLQRNPHSGVFCALVAVALLGWGSFAYGAWSGRQLSRQLSALSAEREEARSSYERLQRAVGDVSKVEARLGAANAQLTHVLRTLASAEYQLAQKRRPDQPHDPATTGSTRDQGSKRAVR
jgi:hypothetical protein